MPDSHMLEIVQFVLSLPPVVPAVVPLLVAMWLLKG